MFCKQLGKLHLQKEKYVEHFGMRGHLNSTKPSPQQEHDTNKSGKLLNRGDLHLKIYHIHQMIHLCFFLYIFINSILAIGSISRPYFKDITFGLTFLYPIIRESKLKALCHSV